jgi:hypothetical protein
MSVETGDAVQDADLPSLTVEQVRARQNFPLAVIAGLTAAIAGAVLWAGVTVATDYKLGLMALAVGYLVGQAIRIAGQGIDAKFGYLGAACGFLGCAGGAVLCNVVFYAQGKSLSLAQTLDVLTPELMARLVQIAFDPMDILFVGIGVYEGYKFAFKFRIAEPAA